MLSISFSDEDAINESAEARELEKLIQTAQEIETDYSHKKPVVPRLREDEAFARDLANGTPDVANDNDDAIKAKLVSNQSILQGECFDSSDEEEMQNYLERKYNEYGRDINKKLKQNEAEKQDTTINKYVNASFSTVLKNSAANNQNTPNRLSQSFNAKPVLTPLPIKMPDETPYFSDPVFGLRIVRPLISGTFLKVRMEGRTPISMAMVEQHTEHGDLSKDWVIAGVVISKSPVKNTKKGDAFSIWKLSDLKGDIKTISLFLFGSAHKDLWKTREGAVVAILNAGVFDKRKKQGDVACLAIDTAQKVMILGESKDLGKCRSRKKNGEPCTAIVNITDCEYCIYHVKQEFNNMSKRSELQSSTAGRGLHDLRNKVLGKSEVFYGGKSFTAIPAKKSVKQSAKDDKRLLTLSEYYQSPNNNNNNSKTTKTAPSYGNLSRPVSKVASTVELNVKQRQKDLERLKLLKGSVEENPPEEEATPKKLSVPEKYQNREFSFSLSTPTLSQTDLTIDVDLSRKKADIAKRKAIATIKKKPVQKADPNFIKYRGTTNGKKRAIDLMNEEGDNEAKRRKIEENERKSRIQKIMDATSSHTNLIKSRQDEERDKYFGKMEKKEALEEKMLSTFKIDCKAVICVQCKYTAFSAADRCKEERHTLKVIDAEKRFFECQDCGNRTATVHKIPKISCKNCSGSKWKRAAMIREKKVPHGADLSIRGDEEKFFGSLSGAANLNLLVPSED